MVSGIEKYQKIQGQLLQVKVDLRVITIKE